MMKRILSFAALAALSMAAANSAGAQSSQVWDIQFYSDSTHTQQVGYAQSVCRTDFQGSVLVWGYSTQYRVESGHRPCGPGFYDDQ